VVPFTPDEAQPERGEVLRSQELPEGPELPERVAALLDTALRLHLELIEPRAVFETLPIDDFEKLYPGEGHNARATPLERVFPQATGLALYAATLGEGVCAEIRARFEQKDLAVAYMLDGVASVAADRLSRLLADRFGDIVARGSAGDGAPRVLPYSPGYCGWHVSGQGRLFARLRPEEIGISLNDSYLMTPIKSVSGVLVAGPGTIHRFRPSYPFCEGCATHACRERIAWALRGNGTPP
jgi:hypothetical protein